MKSLLLERLTSPEIEAALSNGYRSVIIACGAIEQHGPHLPLFVDAEHGTALAQLIAEKLGNTLVAPTIRVGVSEHHMAFSGTITIQVSTFEAICHDYVDSLSRHGFEHIYFTATHGGNFGPLNHMADKLDEAAGSNTSVLVYANLIELINLWKGLIEDNWGLGDHVGGHADIAETSLMEYLHPEWVERDRAEAGTKREMIEGLAEKIIRDGFKSVTPNGILGDARNASAEIGQQCIEALANLLVERFQAQTKA